MTFPWWFIFFAAFLFGWPFFLVGAVFFGGLGLTASGKWRFWLLSVAGLCLLVGMVGGLALIDHAASFAGDDADSDARKARLHETLAQPRQVLDMSLSAGTQVDWTDEARVEIASLNMPRPARVFGMTLVGSLERQNQSDEWDGELAEDQTVDGWACRKGPVSFSSDRKLEQCVLAADHTEFGVTIPAGSQLAFLPSYDTHDFTLPADRGMLLPLLGATLPPATKVQIMLGQIHELVIPDGKPLMVHGVPFRQSVELVGSGGLQGGENGEPRVQVTGILGDFFTCGGTKYDVDSPVAMSLVDWKTTIAKRQADGPDLPGVDVSSCVKR